MSLSIAGRMAALALVVGTAGAAQAQTRETTFTCQGGGAMIVDLSPVQNGQVVVAIRAALANPNEQTPAAGTCLPRDMRYHDRAQAAASATPIVLRMATRQPLVLNVEVAADQSPRVVLSSQRSDARAEQTLQLYNAAIQGHTFVVTVREPARTPLDLTIVSSSVR